MRRFILTAIAALWTTSAIAEFSVDAVRTLLDQRDFDGLEAAFEEGFETALESGDYDPIRNVHTSLFMTTHPDRIQTTEDWYAKGYETPYAATALAWQSLDLAFLYRGDAIARKTPRGAMAAFTNKVERGLELSKQALEIEPLYRPATDYLLTRGHSGRGVRPPEVIIAEEFQRSPETNLLFIALYRASPNWGGSPRYQAELCRRFATDVDITFDECIAYAVFRGDMDPSLKRTAAKILLESEHPGLQALRTDLILRGYFNVELSAEERLEVMRENPYGSFNDFMTRAMSIARMLGDETIATELHESYIANIDQALSDNPLSPFLIRSRIQGLMAFEPEMQPPTEEEIAEALQVWPDLLVYGTNDRHTWNSGASILMRLDTFESELLRLDFLQNVNATSHFWPEQSAWFLLAATQTLHEHLTLQIEGTPRRHVPKSTQPEQDMAKLECSLIRAYRVFRNICTTMGNESGLWCDEGLHSEIVLNYSAEVMRTSTECLWERTSNISRLSYEFIPPEELDLSVFAVD